MDAKYYKICRNCYDEVPEDQWYSEEPVDRCEHCHSKICPDCGEAVPEEYEVANFPCFCWEIAEAEQYAQED